MMSRYKVTLYLAVVLFGIWVIPAGASETRIEIAIPDTYISADAVTPGAGWWGIYREKEGFTLRPTSVGVSTFPLDEGASGVDIRAAGDDVPLVVLRGGLAFKAGPLDTPKRSDSTWKFLFPGEMRDVTVGQWRLRRQTILTATGGLIWPVGSHHSIFRNYELHLSREKGPNETRQTLLSVQEFEFFQDDPGPTVVWAGDLDGDGETDVVLDKSTFYTGREIELYLSSAAEDGKLVGKVASWTGTEGC